MAPGTYETTASTDTHTYRHTYTSDDVRYLRDDGVYRYTHIHTDIHTSAMTSGTYETTASTDTYTYRHTYTSDGARYLRDDGVYRHICHESPSTAQ